MSSGDEVETHLSIDDGSGAWNRKGAMEEIESLKLMRSMSWDQHTHSFKWLTASLLALNGGGIISIIQLQGLSVDDQRLAGGGFAFGLAFALLVAVFAQHSITAVLAPLQRQIGYWMTVADDGIRDEEIEKQLANELVSPTRLGLATRVFGWLSAICFFAGVVLAGYGLESEEPLVSAMSVQETSKETE